MKELMRKQYVSLDGTPYDNENDCIEYEKANGIDEKIKNIKDFQLKELPFQIGYSYVKVFSTPTKEDVEIVLTHQKCKDYDLYNSIDNKDYTGKVVILEEEDGYSSAYTIESIVEKICKVMAQLNENGITFDYDKYVDKTKELQDIKVTFIDAYAFEWRTERELEPEQMEYIKNNFVYKEYEDVADINDKKYQWVQCWNKNADKKYGRYMVSFTQKIYRSQTMGEFYGGGIVD